MKKRTKLASLRACQIILTIALILEGVVAVRMFFYNTQLLSNEKLRHLEVTSEMYVETYEELSAAKEQFKSENALAALPIAGRIAVYISTISLLAVVTAKRNRLQKKQNKNSMAAKVAVVEEPKRNWIDPAKLYNYPAK